MRYKERYSEIIEIIQRDGRVLVSSLAKQFGVSEVTIRKDLGQLESMGLCRRFHSGAVSVDPGKVDIPISQKVTEHREIKHRIARKALEYVGDARSFILDAGSTTQCIAALLKKRKGIRVVTNSLLAGSELIQCPHIDLLLTGGSVKSESQACVGPIALETLRKVHVDVVFLGAMGVSPERGFSSATILEAQGKETMISASARSIVVADHSKLGTVSFAPFASAGEIDCLITDSLADPDVCDAIRQCGTEVIIA